MERYIDKNSPVELFFLKQNRLIHNFLHSEWDALEAPDEYLMEESLRAGRYGEGFTYIFSSDYSKSTVESFVVSTR